MVFVADLHCDLLSYLSIDPQRTANDFEVRCSIPQLKSGKVKLQTLAISAETLPGSIESGLKQVDIFKALPQQYSDSFQMIHHLDELEEIKNSNKIGVVAAIENASAICTEDEAFEKIPERLTFIQGKTGRLLYLSLTWNSENRFGGGALTKVGLKEDGKLLIDFLASKGIAIDFSHTSDYLAFDILNYIDKKNLQIPVLASHSNLRAVSDFPRNLPDEIAREIIKKNGVIGINFIRYLLGKDSVHSFSKQLEHLLNLGAEKSICFGADFFCIEDSRPENRKPVDVLFFPSYDNASTYEKVIDLWKKELKLSDTTIEDISYNNFVHFFKQVIFTTKGS